jgi:hypothetical protein
VTFYYLPGSTGWESTFAGRPTVLWNPTIQTADSRFGVRSDGFGFNIAGTPNIRLVVEATSSLTSCAWMPLQSLTLTNGLVAFRDQGWTNRPARFYRIRSP